MWLFVPTVSTSSAFAQEAEDSISASSWQCQALAASCSWRGKLSQPANWSARFKKVSWLRPLFGAMLPPSMAALGVASWMELLAASRASRTVLPASGREVMTSETSGPMRGASSSSPVHGSSSSKTSVACSRRSPASIRARYGSGVTYRDWVSTLREDCLRRKRSARATSESESSSSQWPTMTAGSATRGPDRRRRDTGGANSDLPTILATWPTPTTRDWKDTGNLENVPENFLLGRVAANWRTPTTSEAKRGDSPDWLPDAKAGEHSLNRQATQWSTPRASDAEKGAPNQSFGAGGIPLPAQAMQWQTPSADSFRSRGGDRKDEMGLDQQARSFLPVRPIYPAGGVSSKERRSLNPLFVEWLMGWPPGWTLLAWTDFACSATALSHFKQRMRSELSRLGLPQAAPSAQLGLFG